VNLHLIRRPVAAESAVADNCTLHARDSGAQIMKRTFKVVFLLAVLLISTSVRADVGVFTGTGQDLRQISTESIQLVSIHVTMVLGRGPFLFDGTVPGMDQVQYDCRFELRNLTDKACDVQVGFPIDSQFARLPHAPKDPKRDWVGQFSFNARDKDNTYHVRFQSHEPQKDDKYSALFVWKMSFGAKEARTLTVQYRIPLSMTLAATSKQGIGVVQEGTDKHPWIELLGTSMLEVAGYTTETGSSWSGNVETATFTAITKPFEQYLDYRGLLETKVADLPADARKTMVNSFPVSRVWSYRDVQPAGWHAVNEGIEWEYKNYKPKDPITIRYFLMQFPRVESEVDPWVDAIIRTIPDQDRQPAELAIARQILLATYGQKPSDDVARAFAENQIWYSPRADFALSKLTEEQKAVLKALDRRCDTTGKAK